MYKNWTTWDQTVPPSKHYNGHKFPKNHVQAPFATGYRPELNVTPELGSKERAPTISPKLEYSDEW